MRSLIALFLLLSCHPAGAGQRPYATASPWNQPIPADAKARTDSADYVRRLSGVFGSRTDKYSFPVYRARKHLPTVPIRVTHFYSDVTENGSLLDVKRDVTLSLRIPPGARPARGKDRHLVLWDPDSGDEWGFWHVRKTRRGWQAENGYHYNTRWSAVPPRGFISRGAGIPYLAGLIRPWEIRQGEIRHAIAFGVDYPSPLHVHPATKSDGRDTDRFALPMGSRLQLDPGLTDADFARWGLDRTGRIIARALQRYGMILVDGSGHPKIYAEYDGTADWRGRLHGNTVRTIPYSAFRVLLPADD